MLTSILSKSGVFKRGGGWCMCVYVTEIRRGGDSKVELKATLDFSKKNSKILGNH